MGGGATDTNFITYDTNPLFHILELSPTASNTLTVTASSTATDKNQIAAPNYAVKLNLQNTVAIEFAYRIAFELTNSNYEWVAGTCVN